MPFVDVTEVSQLAREQIERVLNRWFSAAAIEHMHFAKARRIAKDVYFGPIITNGAQ
jgi:hypothetical protein